jgi:hypothetical protein
MDMGKKTSFAWLSRQRPRSRDLEIPPAHDFFLNERGDDQTKGLYNQMKRDPICLEITNAALQDIDVLKLLG